MKKLITRAMPGTVKVLKWMYVWDQWIQALSQWAADQWFSLFLEFKENIAFSLAYSSTHSPQMCIHLGPSWAGKSLVVLNYYPRSSIDVWQLSSSFAVYLQYMYPHTYACLYLLNILRWIKSWKVYYFIAVVMFIMSDQESSILPTASPGTSVATIAIW